MSVEQRTAAVDGSRAKTNVVWLIAARASLFSLVLCATTACYFLDLSIAPFDFERSLDPLIYMFAFSAVSAIWLRLLEPDLIFISAQLAADTFFITILIYLSGGPISPFLFLYLPHVMSAAILLRRRVAFLVGALDLGAYMLLAWALTAGYITPLGDSSLEYIPIHGFKLQFIGLGSAIFLIAVATSFLVRKLRFSDDLLAQSRRELTSLSNTQKQLIETLPEGVITTDLEDAIININQAALDLLHIGKEEVLGKTLSAVIRRIDPKADLPNDPTHHKEGELTIRVKEEAPLKAHYKTREIADENGQPRGKVFSFKDITQLKNLENKLQIHEQMAKLLATIDDETTSSDSPLSGFVGESPVMEKVFKLITRVSTSDATVLIDGESGTGKELVARSIHMGGPRANGPFVPVNCGAIPENLIESQLFGHKKGAFTGAESDHIGLFRQAEGGTIFLDEIGELPLQMQAKLLRALQEKNVRPVGAERDYALNCRIIAATNRNLKKEVEQHKFREDLFYRLNVIHVMLPPLRERKEDIPILVNSILKRLCKDKPLPMVTPEALAFLINYSYPGNVRELENVLERALVIGGEVIMPEHFPEGVRSLNQSGGASGLRETTIVVDENIQFPVKLDEILDRVERKYLEVALIQTNGAKKKAANLLGINFRSFRYRLQKFGIDSDEERE